MTPTTLIDQKLYFPFWKSGCGRTLWKRPTATPRSAVPVSLRSRRRCCLKRHTGTGIYSLCSLFVKVMQGEGSANSGQTCPPLAGTSFTWFAKS